MNGHFLPYRSEKKPEIKAPTDRSISVTVMPYRRATNVSGLLEG
jgi:hypothetical protein